MQNNTIMSTTAVPMRLVYSTEGTAVYKPVVLSSAPQSAAAGTPGAAAAAAAAPPPAGGGRGSAGEPSKRKRGRPRKYGPDGSMVLAVMPVSPAAVPPPSGGGTPVVPAAVPPPSGGGMPVAPAAVPPPSGGGMPITLAAAPPPPPSGGGAPVAPAVAQLPSGGGTPISPAVVLQPSGAGRTSGGFPSVMSLPAVLPKKGKGRPVGSVNKQPVTAFGSSGIGITPYIITVNAGEDVSSKIMSFPQQGPKGICILSANGAVSNVTLRQASTSGGTVTYEGRFEILSLSGSFLLSESGGQRSRTGGLSISLAGPDGRVLGGGVAGLLTAASPVQVVIGSFIVGGQNEVKATNASDTSAAPKITPVGAPVSSSPPSRGTPSESSDGPGSPPFQSTGTCNNSSHQGVIHMPWK